MLESSSETRGRVVRFAGLWASRVPKIETRGVEKCVARMEKREKDQTVPRSILTVGCQDDRSNVGELQMNDEAVTWKMETERWTRGSKRSVQKEGDRMTRHARNVAMSRNRKDHVVVLASEVLGLCPWICRQRNRPVVKAWSLFAVATVFFPPDPTPKSRCCSRSSFVRKELGRHKRSWIAPTSGIFVERGSD